MPIESVAPSRITPEPMTSARSGRVLARTGSTPECRPEHDTSAANGTWQGAADEDRTEIAATFVDVDEDHVRRLRLVDNGASDDRLRQRASARVTP